MSTRDLLTISLQAAVPLWIHKVRNLTEDQQHARAQRCADQVAAHGDLIQHRSKKKGESATAFNGLAEGIAVLAYNAGGVVFMGTHWCAEHHPFGVQQPESGPCAESVTLEQRLALIRERRRNRTGVNRGQSA